ncbi:LacI family DNA-binding transcriptional regulator [Nesterenkonia muleiensis]|uniref:LacI family DNA-binding transcriptional regulator n=1 Tax=Nesterenkonia muleiensis TaxID=2282648 RepID=UPI000E7414CE|nr:LacI family DNA-binding transcriptional regulator [Nesterenkonia muleiensis]
MEDQSRAPTIRDVAREAGVSKSLVSLVFKGSSNVSYERRDRVLKAAETLGYRPNLVAQSLSAGRRNIVAILVSNLSNPIFAEIVGAVKARLSDAGKPTMIVTAQVDNDRDKGESLLDQDNLAMLRDLRPAGLITVGTVPQFAELAEFTAAMPTVVASAIDATDDTIATVRTDDEAGISLVVDHLVDQGMRHIVFVGGSGGTVSATRERAFHAALRRRGLEASGKVERTGLTEQDARRAIERSLSEGESPEAVVAVNDLVAIGVISALEAAGISVPQDCKVTGYDDSTLAAIPRISLTTVDPMNRRIGRESADELLAAMERAGAEESAVGPVHTAPREVLIPPRLVVRGSSQ